MSKHQITMILWCIFGLLMLGTGGTKADICQTNCIGGTEEDICQTNYDSGCGCRIVDCTEAIIGHIQYEFNAAFKYLYMGALYGQYMVERPGISKFFLESATEERDHAIHMMDYLNMRGVVYKMNSTFGEDDLYVNKNLVEMQTLTIEEGLKEALTMEMNVTNKINAVITACADDYHAADVFTNPILEEQHTGMRKLRGALRTLCNLKRNSANGELFADYIFDLKMLKGEL